MFERIRQRSLIAALLLAVATLLRAQGTAIPEAEALYVPTAARLAALQTAAKRDGWRAQAEALRAAAVLAYQRDKLQAAEAWLNVFRWARLWGMTEGEFVPQWVAAVNAAKVGHSNMAAPKSVRQAPMGMLLAPELQAWLLSQPAVTAEFFGLLASVDYVPRVFEILNELHRADAVKFRSFSSLAIALALVHDVPPPPVWPHAQVSEQALPRVLTAPAAAFAWWVRQEQNGRLYHRVSRLRADELKFVVDTVAPLAELEWAQTRVGQPLGQLAQAYAMVRYRRDRVAAGQYQWPGRSYALADILGQGGICSDQAYFATQAGKARGVPTLLFYGAGNDGRHAWFGYLDGNQKWHLDAGRYAEQRFVTGRARDPQTWREFTDHELQFLTERFRELPAYKQSRVHAVFAAEFLAEGRAPLAGAAARRAVTFERRNVDGWETLLAAARAEKRDAKTIESLLREAALALQRYPDLEAAYLNRVAESLRARGERSAADEEQRRVALKNKGARGDLAASQAREAVHRAIATQGVAQQIEAYNKAVDLHGRGAGTIFFDEVVAGFVEYLLELGNPAEAARALERAKRTLKIEPGSQLAKEIEALAERIKTAK